MHYYVSVHLMGINVRIVKLVVQEYSYLWMSLFMNGRGVMHYLYGRHIWSDIWKAYMVRYVAISRKKVVN